MYSPHGGLHPSAAYAANPQQGYVMVLRDYLPPALRGLMVASFLAAYMSTIGTQLNWGTSYLVNDFYRRFWVRSGSEKHYVFVSKIITVILVLASGYVASQLTSISAGWELVLNLGAGTGAVYILRWFWWCINAWSEISAMIVAAVVALGLSHVAFTGNNAVVFAKSTLITAGITTIAWLVATFVTPAEKESTLLHFYRGVHPAVYGWERIAKQAPELPEVRDFAANAFDTAMGCVLVYGTLFGLGKFIFGNWIAGTVLFVLAAVAGYLIWWDLSRRGWRRYQARR